MAKEEVAWKNMQAHVGPPRPRSDGCTPLSRAQGDEGTTERSWGREAGADRHCRDAPP